MLTLGSLFDGSGTAPLCARTLGWRPLWASEIEKYPIEVTKKHFPEMMHLGDITQIDGAKVPPVDIIVGGSPCQDLSTAGLQKGLSGSRSHLFYEMTRIIREMREATNGKYPRWVLWENVPGALSSNSGEDFYEVIKAYCAIGCGSDAIPRPPRDRRTNKLLWNNAGTVVGNGYSIAWRIMDAQWYGVPQRRRRIFLVCDYGRTADGDPRDETIGHTGGGSAGTVLFKPQSVLGNFEPRTKKGKAAAENPVVRADGKSAFSQRGYGGYAEGVGTLRASGGDIGGGTETLITAGFLPKATSKAGTIGYAEETSPTLKTEANPAIIGFCGGNGGNTGFGIEHDVAPTMSVHQHVDVCTKIYEMTGFGNAAETDKSQTLRAHDSKQTDSMLVVDRRGETDCVSIYGSGATCNNAHGMNYSEDGAMYTLNTVDQHGVAYGVDCRNNTLNEEMTGTMQSKSNGGNTQNDQKTVLIIKDREGKSGGARG